MAITSFIAGGAISAGDVVSLNTSSLLFRSIASNFDQSSTIGIAIDSGVAGSLIRVNNDSIYTNASGLTPGETRYVSLLASGQHEPYAVWISGLVNSTYSGAYLAPVGKALSNTSISVETGKPFLINNPPE